MEQQELNILKKMAMADGVLSDNEKNVFIETAGMSDAELKSFFEGIEYELESVQSETEVIDWKHKNGIDFEKYVVNLLPDDYRNLHWTGDKYVDGRYDERNMQPDIIFDIELNEVHSVAIECKFRMSYYMNFLFIARQEQLDRYKAFQERHNIPVYIAVGVGGSGSHPEEMYLIPVNATKYTCATKEYLQQFSREVDKKLFFYVKAKRLF